jgi:hypothetical protein
MQNESTDEDEYGLGEIERNLLYQLTQPEDGQPLWSREDLAREMEVKDVDDYVRSLKRGGLVYETSDGFVFASRAAVRWVQMVGHVC